MKLYTFWRSSAAYRVRIALNLKGIAVESLPVRFRPAEHRLPAYLAKNPQGLVPALETDTAVLAQSLAIIEYLEETRPDPALLPRDPVARAQVRSMALAVACDIHPLNNLRVLNYLRQPLGHDDAQVNAWVRHWISTGLAGLEKMAVAMSGSGRHLFGEAVSVADLCLVPQVYGARRFQCDLTDFPTLVAIDDHLRTLPAFAAAAPERQPDAE